MTRFEPRTSVVGSDHSVNWTTALLCIVNPIVKANPIVYRASRWTAHNIRLSTEKCFVLFCFCKRITETFIRLLNLFVFPRFLFVKNHLLSKNVEKKNNFLAMLKIKKSVGLKIEKYIPCKMPHLWLCTKSFLKKNCLG